MQSTLLRLGLYLIIAPLALLFVRSTLAQRLAVARGDEIVNYDSMQIYRRFDIGTAKPSEADRRCVPHHLYDIVDASQDFNAADYARRARAICDDIVARGRRPILVGGT